MLQTFPVLFSVLAFDQISKWYVLIHGLDLNCNAGFAFGTLPGILNGLIAFSVLLAVIYVFLKHFSSIGPFNSKLFALALVIGGGTSNIFDRVLRGCVIDFINFSFLRRLTWLPLPDWFLVGLIKWPAFNLADAAITIGTIILIYSLIFPRLIKEAKGSYPSSPYG
ncbi:hypothetical protein A3G16_00395 [Candidatus Curtissbacteria bacterium RIFCSPLOWO2_12_FULL_41_16]|nr:MAG: hypothetical protein A3G16_00395 [Candidatus Curtissbacteria bacterium RIFCSPLOWO2_12_FULL_41_16]